eukprot:TRINITY_DN8718_c0_g1_i1.p1 TRINITY_DN8718_c0_g1~~TRINITY_DN8718_c0_g1_i1.p1  ORF type:complete len:260 (+),score=60.83 TRINITY_DN8718_c0_g1_i1:104-781(+)
MTLDTAKKYISFHCLRNHGVLGTPKADIPVTSQIYVHSKLMIVDDKYTIIGSANINDRSFLGERDSEIAVLIKDKEFFSDINLSSSMSVGLTPGLNGKYGKFGHSLRMRLMAEHMGLQWERERDRELLKLLRNPVEEKGINRWLKRSLRNTMHYQTVFPDVPSDQIESLKEYGKRKGEISDVDWKVILGKVKGHLVDFPMRFLFSENMQPKLGDREQFVPATVFV